MRKPEIRPTINRINRHLRHFEASGFYSGPECIRERARFVKLTTRRPKRR